MSNGREWDYEQQSRIFDEMTGESFPAATPSPLKRETPAGAKMAVSFFTVFATWLFVIAMLMPAVWLVWTAAKWMFSF
jgi:hypothetical protein